MKSKSQFLKSILPWKALIIAIIFGLASLFTIVSGVHFYLPGTSAISDPREIFNSLGAAITGPIGGFIIGFLSTFFGPASNLKFYNIIQHLISAIWIGWAYKKLVYEKYRMPNLVFGWLFLIFVYYFISYLPGLIILHFMFNSLFQEFVGGPLTLWQAIIKLYSGWMPEIIFTTFYTTLVLIALPEKYRRPLWGVQIERKEKKNRSSMIVFQKLFLKNFIAIRLSIWFILLFSIPLIYLTLFNRNYFLEYFLRSEAAIQYEAANHVAALLEKTDAANIPKVIFKINKSDERTLLVMDSKLNNVLDLNSYGKENFHFPILSEDQKKQILVNGSGTFIDLKSKTGVGYYPVRNKNLFVLSISPGGKYESDMNHLIAFIYKYLGLTLLIISILSGGIIWIIIGKPLKKLREVADEIGKQNYDVPLDASEMTDEIKSLANAVNEMKSNIKIAEKETLENELKFRLLFETANDAIFILKNDLFVNCNSKTLELFGCLRNEIIGHSVIEFSPVYQSDGVKSEIKAFEKIDSALLDKPQFFEWTHIKRDGTVFEVEVSLNRIQLKDGYFIQTILRDITERKRTYTALQLSEAKFKSLINSMQDLVYTLDRDMNIVGLYGMWSEMYGLSEELLLGKKLTTFLSPAEAEINDVASARACNGESVKFEWSLKSGEDKFFFESSLTPFFGSNNEIIGIVGVAREITAWKKTELRIRESEERYRKLFEGSPDPIIVHKKSKILFINSAGVELLSFQNQEQIIGRNIFDFVHRDYHSIVEKRIVELQSGTDKLPITQIKFVKVDGAVIDVEISTISFLHEGEIAAQVVVRDITERKIAEELLKESEDRYKSIIEYSPDAIAVHSNGKLIFVNPAAIKMIGAKNADELINKPVLDLVHPAYKEFAIERIRQVFKNNAPVPPAEEKIIKLDGTVIDVEITSVPINYGGTKAIQVILRDISEKKRADEQLRKLSQAVEQSPAAIMITDLNGRIEYVNPKFKEVTGYAPEEVIGRNTKALNSGKHSLDYYKELWDAITSGNEWRGEFHNKKKSGELYWEFASISPIKNEMGETTHFLAVKEDITERKRNQEELIRSKQVAEEASKLKSSLLANMSHELRTPLNGILGFSQLLRDEISDGDHLDMLEKIMQSGKRLMNTLNSVLTITELENNNYLISKSEIDLAISCKELKTLYIKQALNKNLEFKLDIKDDTLSIITDESLLTKIISSIIENAIKYTQHGEIKIELTRSIESDGEKYAVINVIDTGIGIREEDQVIIFGEFKQLSEGSRRDFEGLGLGLTLANKMVKLIGGSISVQSEFGKGSKFTLMLPIEIPNETENIPAEQISVKKEIISNSVIRNGNELAQVLLIEDNPLNIEVVQKFLAKICTVSFARDGLTAIEMSKKEEYSLIMIDINLGHGMDGLQVLEEIKKLAKYENKPIIALTGYASETNKKEFLAHGFTHYLAKPFEKRELIKLIKNIFNLE